MYEDILLASQETSQKPIPVLQHRVLAHRVRSLLPAQLADIIIIPEASAQKRAFRARVTASHPVPIGSSRHRATVTVTACSRNQSLKTAEDMPRNHLDLLTWILQSQPRRRSTEVCGPSSGATRKRMMHIPAQTMNTLLHPLMPRNNCPTVGAGLHPPTQV